MEIWKRTTAGWTTRKFSTKKPLVEWIDNHLRRHAQSIDASIFYCIVFSQEEEAMLSQRADGILPPSNTQALDVLNLMVKASLSKLRTNPGYGTYIPENPNTPITEAEVTLLAYALKS